MKKILSGIPRIEKTKIVFQYSLVLLGSFLCGCFLTQLISLTALQQIEEALIYHFELPFVECEGVFDVLRIISEISIGDIICVFILFFSVFTFFNYLISDVILFYVGFNFGFSVCLILKLFSNLDAFVVHAPNGVEIFTYIITRSVYIALALYFCIKLSFSSFKIKTLKPNGRYSISLSVFTSDFALTLVLSFVSVILKLLYCFVIYKF